MPAVGYDIGCDTAQGFVLVAKRVRDATKRVFMKRMLMMAAMVALACGVVRAEKTQPQAMLVDGVAAYVNEHVITIAEVMSEVRGGVLANLPAGERETQMHELYKATLDAMINRCLILDAAKASGASVAPWAVDQRIQEVVNQQFGGDRAKLTTALASQRTTLDDWRKNVEEDLVVQLMRYSHVEKNIVVPAQAVRAYYEANTQQFAKVTGVGVSVVVVAEVDDESAAVRGSRALQELEAGKPFTEIAKTYSVDNKAKNGGDWGVVNPSEMFRDELVDALAKLKAGEHSPLLLLEDHGYIVRKNSEAATEALTLPQAWPRVEARLKMMAAEKKYVDWANRLRRKAYIKIFELPLGK